MPGKKDVDKDNLSSLTNLNLFYKNKKVEKEAKEEYEVVKAALLADEAAKTVKRVEEVENTKTIIGLLQSVAI